MLSKDADGMENCEDLYHTAPTGSLLWVYIVYPHLIVLLAHLSRRLVGELIVYPWSGVRSSVSVVHNFKHKYLCNEWADHNEILSEASLGWGKCLGFGPDWIKTLVSMATDSSHRLIMEKMVLPLFLSCFSSNPF